MNTRASIFLLAAMALTLPVCVQAAGPTPQQLKSWIAARRERVDLLRDESKQIDARIESRLDTLIGVLSKIADSKDSRTKVARMKEETMKTLMKTIEDYHQKRAVFLQDLRNPQTHLTEEEKLKIIGIFDQRIEKRIQQVVTLYHSMPGHKDYERYRATGGGWHGTDYERNQDFEQNRRMTTHGNSQRDAILKQIDYSLARLDRLGRDLRAQLAATTDPAERKERAAEIAKNDALIAERRRQKMEALQPPNAQLRGIGLKEAVDLDQAIKREVDDLRRDFTALFERFHSFVGELTALHATEATLAVARDQH